tara:strand:- start:53 stop:217 length:165 start_codon:yes stop_codon:yes gene_type:complete
MQKFYFDKVVSTFSQTEIIAEDFSQALEMVDNKNIIWEECSTDDDINLSHSEDI